MEQDAALTQRVKAFLTDRGHLNPHQQLEVSADQGIVRLAGVVPTLRDKRRAEELARVVTGVKALRSDLLLNPVMQRNDAELAVHVRDALDADRSVDGRGIEVLVQDGIVTLGGEIRTSMQRRVAVATLWWLIGVQGVRDELRVLYPEDDADDDLADACHIMLAKDPLVDATEVSVLAQDGVITLAGAVGSDVERDAAENTIWGIEGVVNVRNHLLIVPGAMPVRHREIGT